MSEITIVQIQERLGFMITGAFISNELAVKPARVLKRSMWWNESQFDDIRLALITHIQGCSAAAEADTNTVDLFDVVEDDDEL